MVVEVRGRGEGLDKLTEKKTSADVVIKHLKEKQLGC